MEKIQKMFYISKLIINPLLMPKALIISNNINM